MLFWHVLTRLGEAEILLPMALLTALVLVRRVETRRLAGWWLVLLIAAAGITTLSKLAFMGWGFGSASVNFTGVSGHAMFSSAIYPLLLRTYVGGATPGRQGWALRAGCAVALVVGLSRIAIGAHSLSEVLAGWLLGGCVTLALLAFAERARLQAPALLLCALLAWGALMPLHMQASQTHSMVTGLALKLSGRSQPYTRAELLRRTDEQTKTGP
jgi:membrane-associated phospholipid phosphatase